MDEARSAGLRSFENAAWSRWFARVWIDYLLLNIAVGLAIGFVAPDSALLTEDFTFVLIFLNAALWVPIEAVLVARSGRTPGKWLLGLRVVKNDGSRTSFSEALARSAAAWMVGCAFLFPLVFLFTMDAQYKRVRAGRPASWDEKRGFVVEAAPLSGAQIRTVVVVVLALVAVRFYAAGL